jgi:hypothetical protein
MTQTPRRTRATFLIRNQTPRRLEIIGSHNRLKLAPLEQIPVDYRPHEHLGQAGVADRAVAEAAPERDLPSILQFIQPAFTPMTAARP